MCFLFSNCAAAIRKNLKTWTSLQVWLGLWTLALGSASFRRTFLERWGPCSGWNLLSRNPKLQWKGPSCRAAHLWAGTRDPRNCKERHQLVVDWMGWWDENEWNWMRSGWCWILYHYMYKHHQLNQLHEALQVMTSWHFKSNHIWCY